MEISPGMPLRICLEASLEISWGMSLAIVSEISQEILAAFIIATTLKVFSEILLGNPLEISLWVCSVCNVSANWFGYFSRNYFKNFA